MQDPMLWTSWYLLFLAFPFFIIGSIIREQLARRRTNRRQFP